MIEASVLVDDFTQLAFRFSSVNSEIIVHSRSNLIDSVFCQLKSLYFSDHVNISTQYCIGHIIGCDESKRNMIGSVLPLSALEKLFDSILNPKMFQAFLYVCASIVPGIEIVEDSKQISNKANVEYPASFIWAIMALAEIFGVTAVFTACRIKLEGLLHIGIDNKPTLLRSAIGVFQATEVSIIELKTHSHFEKYGRPSEETGSKLRDYSAHSSSKSFDEDTITTIMSVSSGSGGLQQKKNSNSSSSSVPSMTSSRARSQETDVGYESDTIDTLAEEDNTPLRYRRQQINNNRSMTTAVAAVQRKESNDDCSSPPQALSLSTHTATTNQLRSTSPAPFGSATARFQTPTAKVLPRPPVTSTPRFVSSSSRAETPTRSVWRAQHSNDNMYSTPGLYGNNSSEKNSYDSRVPSKPLLTAEDLRMSREIAKLRLQEAKVKEELEASKQRAEREIREARLKSLELKAAVVRTSSAGGRSWQGNPLEDGLVAKNTRRNASPLSQRTSSRERVRSSLSSGPSPSVQNSVQYASHQREIAEEARLKAAQRVREARRAQERKEERQLSSEKTKQNEKWAIRDKKIALFVEKQSGSHRLGDEEAMASPDGLSAHWLRGAYTPASTPSPTKTTFSKSGLRVATVHKSVQKLRYGASPSDEYDTILEDVSDYEEEIGQDRTSAARRGLYSVEALEAVGRGMSPATSVRTKPHSQPVPTDPVQEAVFPVPGSPTNMVSMRIFRASNLTECLGGTSAYVVIDWGKYGRAETHAVSNSTEPQYGATLRFKSPYFPLSPEDAKAVRNDDSISLLCLPDGCELVSFAPPMKVCIFNRNQSVSDELIAVGEIDAHESILRNSEEGPLVLHLYDTQSQPAGSLEFTVQYCL